MRFRYSEQPGSSERIFSAPAFSYLFQRRGTRPAISALGVGFPEPFFLQHAIDLDACQRPGPERHHRKCLLSHVLPVFLANRPILTFAILGHANSFRCRFISNVVANYNYPSIDPIQINDGNHGSNFQAFMLTDPF